LVRLIRWSVDCGGVVWCDEQEASKAKAAGAVPGAAGPAGATGNRVYLGNLHPSITENDLQELLRPFGTVHSAYPQSLTQPMDGRAWVSMVNACEGGQGSDLVCWLSTARVCV
jgi:hypothetical protein